MLTVSEYRDLSSVDNIRELWRDLWWKTPGASLFQSIEWFEDHCRRTADLQQPCVFVVAAAGRPVGLVPWVERSVRGSVGRLRVLSDASANHGFCRGPLGTNPVLTLEAVTNYARAERRWDRLELRHVEIRTSTRARTGRRIDPAESRGRLEESRAVVECRTDWIRYLRWLPADVREKYQRAEQTLADRGKLECIRYRPEGTPLDDDNPRWDLFSEIERGESGADAASARHWLLREMHETATSIAGVDLNLLRLNGQLLAWAYNYRCDGQIEMQRLRGTGEWASAGACVLLGRMLCDGFRRGDESYLFDRETSRTASGWQTGRAASYCRIVYPRHGARLVRVLTAFSR